MPAGPRAFRATLRRAALAIAMLSLPIAPAAAQPASVTPVPGKPILLYGAYDLKPLGYQSDEFFLAGTARSFALADPAGGDGRWSVTPAATAPFATRVVVMRPSDPARFNGTLLVEWLNVTAGQDTPADWMVAHREMLREGYAYVGVSAQKVGVEGGEAVMASVGTALKKADPRRYGALSHPGDAYSYDIFTQAGAALKAPRASGLLGPLRPRRVLALGESQSAAFLTTYVNAIDPVARVYDGFFIHSRFGSGAALDGSRAASGPGAMPSHVRFRGDLRVPLLTLITETDLLGGRLPGYYGSRRPDGRNLRVWELAGAAHADNYLFGGAFVDSGPGNGAKLARVFTPTSNGPGGKADKPFNPGMPHHYVAEAAIAALDHWVRTGKAPAATPVIETERGSTVDRPVLARDDKGLARGGVRTPWVDVPTIRLTGDGNSGGFIAALVGTGEPFGTATLARLYPGGKADYLAHFTASLDAAIAAGHVLAADRQEILEIAALNFAGA